MARIFWNRGAAALVALALAAPVWAQHEDMPDMPGMPGMEGMDHSMHEMHALLGPYPMTREASGT